MVYGILQILHLVFGLFFALLIVCAIRGLSLHAWHLWHRLQRTVAGGEPKPEPVPIPVSASVGSSEAASK
jgi:hypothetical protein